MCIISTYFANHARNFFHTFMSSFADSAGVGVSDKSRLKYFIQCQKYRMMKHPVSRDCLMDPPQFRIMNPKSLVRSVLVGLALQLTIQIENVLLKVKFEFRNIWLVPLVRLEYLPRTKKCWG